MHKEPNAHNYHVSSGSRMPATSVGGLQVTEKVTFPRSPRNRPALPSGRRFEAGAGRNASQLPRQRVICRAARLRPSARAKRKVHADRDRLRGIPAVPLR